MTLTPTAGISQGSTASEDDYAVRLYEPAMAEALHHFVQQFWPSSGHGSDKDPQRLDNKKAPTVLFLKGKTVLGHITSLPVNLSVRSKVLAAHWVVGFMVVPEHRNGLIGPLIIRKVNDTLPCAMTLHVEDNVSKIFKGLGWSHLGVIPEFVCMLNARRLVQHINLDQLSFLARRAPRLSNWVSKLFAFSPLRWVLGTVLEVPTFLLRLKGMAATWGKCPSVTEENEFDEGYDRLWARVADKMGAAVVRDGAYLRRRYGSSRRSYRIFACRKGTELSAYCIVRTKGFHNDARMGNARVGTIVDCLFDPDDARLLHALLKTIVGNSKREGLDAVLCTASLSSLQKVLLVHGFVKMPGNLNFAYRCGEVLNIPLQEWHLMRGDSDADANF